MSGQEAKAGQILVRLNADSDVALRWVVSGTEWNASLDGVIAQLEGKALVGDAAAVIARCASWNERTQRRILGTPGRSPHPRPE